MKTNYFSHMNNAHHRWLICMVLFLIVHIDICAQVERNPLYMKNYVPSPEAYSMMQYEEIPVSLYTGVPNISIPLYNIKINDWILPVTLSYHASGIKVSQEASRVGLGWNLQAGGMISRSVRGKEDFHEFLKDTDSVPDADNIPEHFLSLHNLEGGIFVPEINKDVEPDVFFYNFAGYSGKFYSKKGANAQGRAEDLFILSNPEDHLIIKLKKTSWDEPVFEITAPGNIKYSFKAIEITKRHAMSFWGKSVLNECPHFDSQNYIPEISDFSSDNTLTSWYLTHIQYPTGDEIFFDYHMAHNVYLSPMRRSDVTSYVIEAKDLKNPYYIIDDFTYFKHQNEPKGQATISFEYIYQQPRLTGIRWSDGELEFVPAAKNREDVRTLKRENSEGAKMLGKINLYTKDRKKKIRSYLFHYSYFLGTDINGIIQKTPDYCTARLKLDSMSISGIDDTKVQKYKMEYNDSEPFPLKNGYACDLWGYYNGSEVYTPFIPYVSPSDIRSMTLTIDENNNTYRLARDGNIIMERGKKIYKGEEKEPSSKTLAGILTSLTTPLEGKTDFKYELNRVIDSTRIEWKIQDSISIDIHSLKRYDDNSFSATFSMPYDGCIDINWVYDGNTDSMEKEKNTTLINIPGVTSIIGIPQNAHNSGSSIHEQYRLQQRTACKKGTYTITLNTSDRAKLSVIIKRYKAKLGYCEQLVGGLRIAEIKSPLTTRKYYYTNDKGECSGRLNRNPVYNRVANNTYYATYSKGIPIANFTYIEFNSAAIQPLENPYNSYFMGYNQVNIIQHTKDGQTITEKNYFYNEKENHKEFFVDYPGKNMPLNGKLIKHQIYSGDELSSQSIKRYNTIKVSDIKGLKYYSNKAEPQNYHIENYVTQLVEEVDTTYIQINNTLVVHPVNKTYFYNLNYLPSRVTSKENNRIKSLYIRYATDFTYPYLDGYFEKYNLITTPIEEVYFADGILSKKLWHIHYKDSLVKPWKEYIFYNRPGGSIPTFNGNVSAYAGKPDVIYDSYTKRGRYTSFQTRMGQSVVLLWGYQHQHIIARITNATLAEVVNKGIDIEALADKVEPTEADWDLLHSLREKLPQAEVVVTRYEPLIGIVSQTGPSGVTVRYTYDEFGRLSETIETGEKENVLQKNEYKYATEN